jgi:hypothetical protein
MSTRLTQLVFDAADPGAVARFWSSALDWPITFESSDEVEISPPPDDESRQGQLPLVFVPVSDPKVEKNRIHLDLSSRSEEHQAGTVAQLEGLGARRINVGQPDAVSWVVMADPEGNEFCVLHPTSHVGRDETSAIGTIAPVGAIVFDVPDPFAVAPFWSAATGWPIIGRDATCTWLRSPVGNGPYLDLEPTADPKQAKLRVHIDVAPYPTDDQSLEVARLEHFGAQPTDIGQGPNTTWQVLSDPQGNELCVLSPR